jgi:hypothetical protein
MMCFYFKRLCPPEYNVGGVSIDGICRGLWNF